jgi:hypothetical protein
MEGGGKKIRGRNIPECCMFLPRIFLPSETDLGVVQLFEGVVGEQPIGECCKMSVDSTEKWKRYLARMQALYRDGGAYPRARRFPHCWPSFSGTSAKHRSRTKTGYEHAMMLESRLTQALFN